MDVTAQWVRIWWTKRSRGEPGASARNAAPVASPLPAGRSPLVHEVSMREEHGFAPESTIVTDVPFGLRPVGDRLGVRLEARHWAPERGYRPEVLLAPGEWTRWQINYRYTTAPGHGDWRYLLETLNLGYGIFRGDAFLGEPDHYVDERARLL